MAYKTTGIMTAVLAAFGPVLQLLATLIRIDPHSPESTCPMLRLCSRQCSASHTSRTTSGIATPPNEAGATAVAAGQTNLEGVPANMGNGSPP
jgi:hypothetical protein